MRRGQSAPFQLDDHRPLAARLGLCVLSLLVALLSVGWAPLPQQNTVVVRGQVVNRTPGGAVPEGLPVLLHVRVGGEETEALSGTISADGTFVFEGLSIAPGSTVQAQVTYLGVDYFSDSITLEAGQTEIDLPVTVYEVTEDPTDVQVVQLHIFMAGSGDTLQVGEYYLIGNTGDRTYVGTVDSETGQRLTVRFTLPEEATALSFDGPGLGGRFVELAEGFADTAPVPPGQVSSEVLFRYALPYREELEIRRVFAVPVTSVVIIMPIGDLALEGPGLVSAGTVDTQMGPSFSYTAGPFAAGESLVATLVPAPEAPPTGTSPTSKAPPTRHAAREAAIGLAALAVAVVAAYYLLRTPAPEPMPAKVRPLVERIAALDEAYQAGHVPEKTYRKKRGQLMREARAALEASSPRRSQN